MATPPTFRLPKHAFVGEEVDLLVNYVPDKPATVRFRIELMPSKTLIELHEINTTGTPARLRWTVDVPPFNTLPVDVRFTAILPSPDMSLTSPLMTVHPKPSMSIWGSHALAKEAKPGIEALITATIKADGTTALFDVSALATIRPQAADPRLIEWDTEVPRAAGGDNVKRRARFKEVIDFAHSKGVRVFAGYEAVEDANRSDNPNAKRFMAFVRSAVVQKGDKEVLNTDGECEIKGDVVEAHVNAISKFLYTDPSTKLDWDGIGFDIEIGALHPRYRSVMRALYHGLAKKHPDKFVTFACFGFTAPGRGRNGALPGHQFFETQTFDLCEGHRNIIARTMLYEETVDQSFVKAINNFAFGPKPGGLGLLRHQVQQGFQGDLQPGQEERPEKITDNNEMIQMIKDVLRPDACGLIYFGLFSRPKVDTDRMKFFPTLDETYRKKLVDPSKPVNRTTAQSNLIDQQIFNRSASSGPESAPLVTGAGIPDEEPEVIDPSSPDLRIDPRDERIDVGAKFALQRMLKVPGMAADAARLIRGINNGTLAGIFGDDLGVSVKIAEAHGTVRWELVPKGEDAALVLDAELPLDAPPTVIFRGDTPDIRNTPTRIDPALQKAGQTFFLFQQREIGPCDDSPSAIQLSNLVPPSFCHVASEPLEARGDAEENDETPLDELVLSSIFIDRVPELKQMGFVAKSTLAPGKKPAPVIVAHTNTSPAQDVGLAPLIQRVIAGEFAHKGQFDVAKGAFVDPDLDQVLQAYAKFWLDVNGKPIDTKESTPSALSKIPPTAHVGADTFGKVVLQMPAWVNIFQNRLITAPGEEFKKKLPEDHQATQRLLQAFLNFDAKQRNGGVLVPNVEEFFFHVGKTEQNGQSEILGGPEDNWCAPASSLALIRGLLRRGLRFKPPPFSFPDTDKTYRQVRKQQTERLVKWFNKHVSFLKRGKPTPLEPGQVITVINGGATGPLSGHVATVVKELPPPSQSEKTASPISQIIYVSGNAAGSGRFAGGFDGSIRVELVTREDLPPSYNYEDVSDITDRYAKQKQIIAAAQRELAKLDIALAEAVLKNPMSAEERIDKATPPAQKLARKSLNAQMKMGRIRIEAANRKLPVDRADATANFLGKFAPVVGGVSWVVKIVDTSKIDELDSLGKPTDPDIVEGKRLEDIPQGPPPFERGG